MFGFQLQRRVNSGFLVGFSYSQGPSRISEFTSEIPKRTAKIIFVKGTLYPGIMTEVRM